MGKTITYALCLLVLLLCGKVGYGQVISTVAGGGSVGLGEGVTAISASIGYTAGIAVDKHGNLYIADGNYHRIRKVNAASHIITTIAGTGVAGFSGDGGPATDAQLNNPTWITVDTADNVYITDPNNNRIRKVSSTGVISTFAGSGTIGFSGDGGPAISAHFNGLQAIETDREGNVYIIDGANFRVRKVNSAGIVTTIAGNGSSTYGGDGGAATSAGFINMAGISCDRSGNLNIADVGNCRIRKVDRTSGIISTVAGNGTAGFSGDGGAATYAQIRAFDVAVDDTGNLYLADDANNRIRKVNMSGTITTIAGTGTSGFSGDGGSPLLCTFYRPEGVCFDNCGNLYIADQANRRVRKIFINSLPTIDTPAVSIVASIDTVCSGIPVTYFATVTGSLGATSAYMWYRNDTLIIGASTSSYTYFPSVDDTIKCVLATTNPCTMPAYATSNRIHTIVSTGFVPAITVAAVPSDTLCGSIETSFTATTSGGGATPGYTWMHNGIVVAGATSSVWGCIPAHGDSIRCILTSSAPCAIPPVVSSNTVNMVVDTLNSPTITLSGPSTSAMGATVTITATLTGAGSSYTIHWYNHGITFATTTIPSVNYTKTLPTDSITARLVPDVRCTDSALSLLHIVAHDLGISDAIVSSLSVWPNPAGDVLHIESTTPLQNLTITNLLGQVVYSTTTTTSLTTINIAHLPPGVYLLRSGQNIIKWAKL